MNALIPLSLYVHMPWCLKKCPYCDFNSHALKKTDSESDYIDALITDLKAEKALIDKRPIHSIFIGGGTPSLISEQGYERLFDAIFKECQLSENAEITLEANPGSVERNRFKGYRAIGINRLSLGIQSFNDLSLKKLGRVHSSLMAKQAVETAQLAGFDNFNLDLMHGLPEQSAFEAKEDIETALEFNPPHLSWYQLTIEPNTVFYKKRPNLPDEQTLAEIESQGQVLLRSYNHYETSAYCKPGLESRHNLNYWHYGDYIGIGAGASGKVSSQTSIIRRQKKRQPNQYIEHPTWSSQQTVAKSDQLFEFMLNNTRLRQKVPLTRLFERTFLDKKECLTQLQQAKETKLIDFDDDNFWVTTLGQRYLNDLQSFFLA